MSWIIEHWQWIGGALIVLFILRALAHRVLISVALMALDDLENIVDQRVGRYFSAIDRRKIAGGMLAILVAKKISAEQLRRIPGLVDAVMLEAITILAQRREIAPPPQVVTASAYDV